MSQSSISDYSEYRWLAPQQAPYELRSLDLALAKLVRRRTGSAALARLLAWLSAAERQGHASLAVSADELQAALGDNDRARAWVGDGNEVTPVVWSQGQLWMWRNWRHEAQIAAALLGRASAANQPSADLVPALDVLYPDPASADQRRAVAAALGRRLFVLTGGPGTGKTTTVLRLLLLLLRQAQRPGARPPEFALAAPTGKAAARLAQAIRAGKQGLAAALPQASWQALLAQVPEQASTLHRLLAYHPATDAFGRDRRSPLAADVVVVDEASMVDLALMRALTDALPESAMLVLVGDADQLVSVSAGSVLADVVAAAESEGPLQHIAARLTHVWRAGSALATVYERLRRGDVAGLSEALSEPAQSGCRLQPCLDAEQLGRRVDQWLASEAVAQSMRPSADLEPQAALTQMLQHQLLCGTRSGPFGASSINARIDAQLRPAGGPLWYPGRRIIITQNDYGRRLYNGDVGIAISVQGALRIYFQAQDELGGDGTRSLLPQELPEHDLAFAMTVHKSQGSEYEHIAVILPPDPQHPLLSRQLLYTAVSRARQSAALWTSSEALLAALQRVVRRQGGLRARLSGKATAEARPA